MGVGVGHEGVISLLPALIVCDAAIKVAAIIATDGVAKDFSELLVNAWWVSRRQGDGHGVSIGGID